jgi:hypothetical protein
LPCGSQPFAVGVFGALHHATLRHKVVHPGQPRAGLTLLAADEGPDLADSWDGWAPGLRLPLMPLSPPGEGEFPFPQDLGRVIQEGESDGTGLTAAGSGARCLTACAVRVVRQVLAARRQVVRTLGILPVGAEFRAFLDQRTAPAE